MPLRNLNRKALRILFVQCEFSTWKMARSWSYCAHLGLEEGFKAHEIEFLTLSTLWMPQARKICEGKQFDQVWINDLAHFVDLTSGYLGDSWLEWLASLAPTCVGFLTEPFQYSDDEKAAFPWLIIRSNKIEKYLNYVTHVVAIDEKDVDCIETRFKKPVIWSPFAVPARLLNQSVTEPSQKKALFSGTIYGERA